MPQQTGPNFGIPFGYDQGEGNWKAAFDAFLVKLDCIVQLSVQRGTDTSSPASVGCGPRGPSTISPALGLVPGNSSPRLPDGGHMSRMRL